MNKLHELLNELEKKADAATPGPWQCRFVKLNETWPDGQQYVTIAAAGPLYKVDKIHLVGNDMEFIASCNPETVKKLISALRVADGALSFYADIDSWDERWNDHGYFDGYCYDVITNKDTRTNGSLHPIGGKRSIEARNRIREIFEVKE